MTPLEWMSWIRGAKAKQLDMREHNLHLATANGVVQGGKSLKAMQRQINEQREALYQDKNEIEQEKVKKQEIKQEVRKRQIEASDKFFSQFSD